MISPYQQALDLGHTDEDLLENFTKKDPEFRQKYDKAIQLGHTPEQVFTKAQESYTKQKEQPHPADTEDDLDKEIERHIGRLTSRGLEQVVGAAGNLRDLGYAVKKSFRENYLPEDLKNEPKMDKYFDETIPIANNISKLIGYLPTSKELKGKSQELTKGYTTPQGKTEEIGDEVFESLVQSALPGQGPRNVWKNIAAPVAGVLGKEAIKYMGGGEKSQALTQLGLNLVLPLMAGNAPQLNREVWNDVRQSVPNVTVPTQQLLTRARGIEQRIQRGLGSRSETQAERTLNNLIEKLERGTISADELMASNISLNEIVGDPELFGRGGHWFEEMRGIIREGMEAVGQQAPEWYQRWQGANEIHGAIANSNHIANMINRHAEPMVSEGARALFRAASHGTAKAAAVLPPVYAIYKGTQILQRMAQSPHLMQYYNGVMVNALRGNTARMAAELEKLDEALLKEEKKPKPPFKSSSPKK